MFVYSGRRTAVSKKDKRRQSLRRLRLLVILPLLLILSIGWTIGTLTQPRSQVAAWDGSDLGVPDGAEVDGKCGGVGGDYNGNNMGDLRKLEPAMFELYVVDRTSIIVKIAEDWKDKGINDNNTGATYGEIFGDGCLIRDSRQDTEFSWQKDKKKLIFFSPAIHEGKDFSDSSNTGYVHDGLGTMAMSGDSLTGDYNIKLHWVMQNKRRLTEDSRIFFGSNGEWKENEDGADLGEGESGLVIPKSQIHNSAMFNHALELSGDKLKATHEGNSGPYFEECTKDEHPGITVFCKNSTDDDYLIFSDITHNTDYLATTADDWVDMEFYNKPGDHMGTIKVLGGNSPLRDATDAIVEESGVGELTPSCETVGGAFSFIICPALKGMNDGFNWLDNKIADALAVDGGYYKEPANKAACTGWPNNPDRTDPDCNIPIKSAWARVRNISYILLIPIMLLLVIGTALQFSFIDAYTVKRAMPRLLAAIIFMALSYDVCVFLVDAFNDIGRGVGGLVAAPWGGADALTLDKIFNQAGLTANDWKTGVLAFIAWSFVGTEAIVGLLATFVAPALLMLVIIYILLMVRELLIVFAIIFAPLAILAWIFPGNDKMWKLWWGTFSKMLYIFPIIMGFLMIGRGFAATINVGDETGAVQTILKVIAFVGPYFFIPKAFQMAGGAFAQIAGMANDRGRGVFDRAKKKRGAITDKRGTELKRGQVYKGLNPNSMLGRAGARVNRATGFAANIGEAGTLRPGRARTNIENYLDDQAHDLASEAKDKSRAFRSISGDDAKMYAGAAQDRQQIAQRLADFDYDRFGGDQNADARDRATEQIIQSQRDLGYDAFHRARIRAQAKTGTGYQRRELQRDAAGNVLLDANGQAVYSEPRFDASAMLEDINMAYGNDRNGAGRALAEMRSSLTESGQIAGQAGFGTWAGQLEGMHNASVALDREQMTQAQYDNRRDTAHNVIMDNTIDSAGAGYAVHGKPTSARELGAAHFRRIQGAADNLTQARISGVPADIDRAQADLDSATASAAGILDAMGSASPQNARAFSAELMGQTVQGTAGSHRLRERVVTTNPNGSRNVGYQDRNVIVRQDQTVRELIDLRMGDTAYREMRRDWSDSVTADAARQSQQNTQTQPPTPGGPTQQSDSRLKTDINYMRSVDGIPMYSFRYAWSDKVYIGTIAQEIIDLIPEAVIVHPSGYLMVDYSLLPFDMMTIEEYFSPEKIVAIAKQ